MKSGLALLVFALLLALMAGQSLFWLGPEREPGPALATSTALAGEARAPVDHFVYVGGCGGDDLHIVNEPLAVGLSFTFCAE